MARENFALNRCREAAYRFESLIYFSGPRVAAADAETVEEVLPVSGKNGAWCYGDAVPIHGSSGKLCCVQLWIKFYPQNKPSLRPRDTRILRKITDYRAAESLKLFGEEAANFSKMRIVRSVLKELGDRHLRDCRACQRLIGLKLQDAVSEFTRRNPTNPQTGSQRFGDRTTK